jgi:hypothetical protein
VVRRPRGDDRGIGQPVELHGFEAFDQRARCRVGKDLLMQSAAVRAVHLLEKHGQRPVGRNTVSRQGIRGRQEKRFRVESAGLRGVEPRCEILVEGEFFFLVAGNIVERQPEAFRRLVLELLSVVSAG